MDNNNNDDDESSMTCSPISLTFTNLWGSQMQKSDTRSIFLHGSQNSNHCVIESIRLKIKPDVLITDSLSAIPHQQQNNNNNMSIIYQKNFHLLLEEKKDDKKDDDSLRFYIITESANLLALMNKNAKTTKSFNNSSDCVFLEIPTTLQPYQRDTWYSLLMQIENHFETVLIHTQFPSWLFPKMTLWNHMIASTIYTFYSSINNNDDDDEDICQNQNDEQLDSSRYYFKLNLTFKQNVPQIIAL